jgi:hypothetical protein
MPAAHFSPLLEVSMSHKLPVRFSSRLFALLLTASLLWQTGFATPVLATAGPALSVNIGLNRKPISPYIYGLNFAKPAFAAEMALSVMRWGGNATLRYNWQTGNNNNALDWYYENGQVTNAYNWNINEDHNDWIARNLVSGADSIITIPMLGYVAKDASSCGFNTAKYGAQDDADPYRPACGNGVIGGVPIAGNDPLDTSIATNEAFMQAWVADMVSKYGSAASGGVKVYNLDNEPELWSETHRDVHPAHQTYDELVNKSISYAEAIKTADPNAKTLGFTSYGWTGYWYSQYDAVTSANNGYTYFPDYATHGNKYQVEWYLSQMAQAGQTYGARLLDYLDLHYYQAGGGSLVTAGDAALQAKRLRSTRALWDPTYIDESWIGGPDQTWRQVQLISRMKGWVAANYPGTKLAITEYNWGGLESINGALAQADVLGIFGREGLDLATLWNYPNPSGDPLGYDHFETLPGAYAFRLYRNYDGKGGQFGDVSVKAASANQGQLAIYAAQRTKDGALTLMVVNKTGGALTSPVTLANFKAAATAKVYRYSPANLSAIVAQPAQAVSATGFTATFPANSITLFVIPKQLTNNGGFNSYASGEKIPLNWSAANFAASDGKDTGIKKEGAASVKVGGAAGKVKTLTQTLALPGAKNDAFTFSYWAQANALPTAGLCQVQVFFYNGATLLGTPKTLKCPAGTTYAWKQAKVTFLAPAAYSKVVIRFTYSKASGAVWWDAVSLTK